MVWKSKATGARSNGAPGDGFALIDMGDRLFALTLPRREVTSRSVAFFGFCRFAPPFV
jgi:hypothetical protein